MGMSASQARYLSLIARQSNLEYQGQQINQERTILSQQCTALYNSLLAMTVPTPPSTSDFTTVQYSGTNGATTYTFSANDVKPGKDGGYNITLGFTAYGNSLTRNNGYAATSAGAEEIRGNRISKSATTASTITRSVDAWGLDSNYSSEEAPDVFFKKTYTKPTSGTYYVMDETGTALVQGGKGYVDNEDHTGQTYYILSQDPKEWDPSTCIASSGQTKVNITTDVAAQYTIKQSDLDKLYEVQEDGTLEKAEEGIDYTVDANGNVTLIAENLFLQNNAGGDKATIKSKSGYKIAGKTAMSMEQFKATFTEATMDTYNGYCEAIENSGLKDKNGNACKPEDFMVYLDDNGQAHFALKSDVMDNDTCVTYDYLANGSYTKNKEYENAKLTFDSSTGRITTVEIPVTDDDGNIISWTAIEMEAKTVTDELAYQDAYNDYEYEQYLYDKKQQEINAKTEMIQQEDRNLELKLQRLDNERTQITTEIEALDKVINDNIESSYKTFSG